MPTTPALGHELVPDFLYVAAGPPPFLSAFYPKAFISRSMAS